MMRLAEPSIVEQGPKPVVRGLAAAASTDSAIVTETILRVMRQGGGAADAAVAGCLVQATVEPFMTNHAGTVVFLYWDAASRTLHALNSTGTLVPRLAPFRPVPAGTGGYAFPGQPAPMACIPGFMPGLKAIHERFCTWKWADLCADAIAWAEQGHTVSSFEHRVNLYCLPFVTYFQEGREFFTPGGFLPPVGTRSANPALARTLRRCADQGPEDFIEGEWAHSFVRIANDLGWPIGIADMAAEPPRWGEPLRFRAGAYEVAQFAPPEQQGVFCALVLGVLSELGAAHHEPGSAEALWARAVALRWARRQMGYVNDPSQFSPAVEVWLDPDFHRKAAVLLRAARPRVDLTDHVRLTTAPTALRAAGLPGGAGAVSTQPSGSCELAIVDAQGNWVQMMNTLQSGGIPGMVVEGVPMVGSHALLGDLSGGFGGWLAPGGRLRLPLGSTMLLADGEPVLSTGTPGNVHCTVPQVLSNIVHHGMTPGEATAAPRMLPLENDHTLPIESRLRPGVMEGLMKLGVRPRALGDWDWHMGSFQTCWREGDAGLLSATADPRRCGVAQGIPA